VFVDEAHFWVRAGDGGRGCQSYYYDRRTGKKYPDGGDGGAGGNVIIESNQNISSLIDIYYKKHFKASAGKLGSSQGKTGGRGKDCIIKVPLGVVIYDAQRKLKLRELLKDKESFIVARGGKAGKGNTHVKRAEPGQTGESRYLYIELKSIADVGLVGLPNVGKSCFLNRISNAKSRIGNYPFTTRQPVLGKSVANINRKDFSFIIADLPGIIKDAHRGKGLGSKFLRHIERCNLLLILIDASSNSEMSPISTYKIICSELQQYGKGLENKPYLVAFNKMDLPGAKENFLNAKKYFSKKIWPISAKTGEGIDSLAKEIIHYINLEKYEHISRKTD
jgi:GTP-binding protein